MSQEDILRLGLVYVYANKWDCIDEAWLFDMKLYLKQ